ncbi:MAG: AAA family ATPase [bacterium]|nr:AAA family ATPase [bacterium]
MPTPVLHLVAGPNGAGKTTFYEEILGPVTRLPFINADVIALERWPNDAAVHAYEAAEEAARRRAVAIENLRSFITETVFSHPSKLDLLRAAGVAGYRRYLHVILIPEELAVRRVGVRVETGGHDVPEDKIRNRYRRLWSLVRQAIALADEVEVRDNSRAKTPFRTVARYLSGDLVGSADWPSWTPEELRLARE